MKTILRPYLFNQVRTLKKFTNRIPDEITSDWIHDLRVTQKELRSAFQLMEWHSPKKISAKKLWKPFKKLHKTGGAYRDICVIQTYFESKNETPSLSISLILEYINGQKEIQHNLLFEGLQQFKKPKKKRIKVALKDISKLRKNKELMKTINLFSYETVSTISVSLLAQNKTDETYHAIRRQIKMLYFLLLFFKKEDYKKRLILSTKWCKQISEILGDWHDRIIAGLLLDQFILEKNETLSSESILEFEEIRDEIKLEKEQLLQRFHTEYEPIDSKLENWS